MLVYLGLFKNIFFICFFVLLLRNVLMFGFKKFIFFKQLLQIVFSCFKLNILVNLFILWILFLIFVMFLGRFGNFILEKRKDYYNFILFLNCGFINGEGCICVEELQNLYERFGLDFIIQLYGCVCFYIIFFYDCCYVFYCF